MLYQIEPSIISPEFRIYIESDASEADVRLTVGAIYVLRFGDVIAAGSPTVRDESPTAYDRVDDRVYDDDSP